MILTVGDTAIPYAVRESAKATRKRIVVTPGGVEVVVPVGTPQDAVEAYVRGRRRWVFDAVRAVEEQRRAQLVQRWASGAKIQLRGRWIMLDVAPADVEVVSVSWRNKIQVRVPEALGPVERLEAVRAGVEAWLRERALDDAERYGRHHEGRLGVAAAGYALSEAKGRWGSCGKDRVVRVHWRLIQAPAPAMEYVVAHEVAHLRHRNHSPAFWAALATTLADWPERKRMLERWEGEGA